jgi:aryl-alcohol dehydrogenase-like predicted oxidoreductase
VVPVTSLKTLQQGAQTLKQLYALLDELEMPIAELAIRFVISDPDITFTLMGARSAEEVETT